MLKFTTDTDNKCYINCISCNFNRSMAHFFFFYKYACVFKQTQNLKFTAQTCLILDWSVINLISYFTSSVETLILLHVPHYSSDNNYYCVVALLATVFLSFFTVVQYVNKPHFFIIGSCDDFSKNFSTD